MVIKKINLINKQILRQCVCVIAANLCMVVSGLNHGWISPVLVKLRSETEPVLSRQITEEEGSWIVSALLITMFFCNGFTSYLADKIGRKYCILLGYIPNVATCVFYFMATDVWMLVAGRSLAGISFAFMLTLIPTYSAEIASKEVRGALGTVMHTSCCLGIVIMLCIGPHLSYGTLNIILAAMTLFCLIPFIFVPDTPYFLFSKGKLEESKRLLISLRGSEFLADEEILEYSKTKVDVTISKMELMKNKLFLKPLLLVIILGITGQMSGFNVISMYLQTIFEDSHTTVSSEWASTAIGVIQLIASFGASLSTDKFGRKPILISTYFGMGISMVCFGAFFKLKEANVAIVGALNYLPIICITLFVFCFNAGHGAVYYVLASELVEGPARTLLGSLALQTSALVFFVTIKSYPILSSILGPSSIYWFFSLMAFTSSLFVAFFIPETKGKSFTEIQENLGAK